MKTLQFLGLVGVMSVALVSSSMAAENVQKLLTEAQTAYMRGDVDTAKSTFEMVNKLDPRNQTAIAFLRRIQVEQAAKGGAGVQEKKLATVVIQKIEFKDATLREALEFLRKKVNETPGNAQQVNFVMKLPEEQVAASKITLNLATIPFTEALRYIGELAGVTFEYDKYAILVKPASGKAAAEVKAPGN